MRVLATAAITTEDASLKTAVESAAAACAAASGGEHVRELTFDAHKVTIREISLGHGVGARLWWGGSLVVQVEPVRPAVKKAPWFSNG